MKIRNNLIEAAIGIGIFVYIKGIPVPGDLGKCVSLVMRWEFPAILAALLISDACYYLAIELSGLEIKKRYLLFSFLAFGTLGTLLLFDSFWIASFPKAYHNPKADQATRYTGIALALVPIVHFYIAYLINRPQNPYTRG